MKRVHSSIKWIILLLLSQAVFAQQGDTVAIDEEETREVISITTTQLNKVLINTVTRLSADAVSLNHAQISAQATGEVLDIEVEVGDTIVKGATLVTLDCRQSKLNRAAAQNSLKLARQEFKRAQSLGKTRTIAEQQLNQAQSTLDQARISQQQAEIAVENCSIKAPFDGVVTQRQIQLGALAVPGSQVLELLQTDAVEVELQLSDDQLTRLQKASDIKFEIGNVAYGVSIRAVLPLVNKLSNKRSVRLGFTQGYPLVGSAGDIVWAFDTPVLPVDFIVERNKELGYFIVEDNVARFVLLANAQMGHPAALEALRKNPEEIELIVQGRYRVEEGSLINVLN